MKGKLYHGIPAWVAHGTPYHIRLRVDSAYTHSLTKPQTAAFIINTARHYHAHHRWYLHLMLLMPDHIHALLTFSPMPGMSQIISQWKHYITHTLRTVWQTNYFDHRLRNNTELTAKISYIRMNPVVSGLCTKPDDWPWVVDTIDMEC